MTHDLLERLRENPYPGRGILLGLCPGRVQAFMAYFIMGRSENSRNRVFVGNDGGIMTQAADPAKMKDPSLIIYAPVRQVQQSTVVTNGDQTDTIVQFIEANKSFEDALRTRSFEPDAPNYTPRISGLLNLCFDGFSYHLSILKSAGGNAESVQRFFFDYPQPQPGVGHFIHTYAGVGEPLPSFIGEPLAVDIPADAAGFGKAIWQALNADNKVALFVRTLTLDGEEQTWVYNKYDKN